MHEDYDHAKQEQLQREQSPDLYADGYEFLTNMDIERESMAEYEAAAKLSGAELVFDPLAYDVYGRLERVGRDVAILVKGCTPQEFWDKFYHR